MRRMIKAFLLMFFLLLSVRSNLFSIDIRVLSAESSHRYTYVDILNLDKAYHNNGTYYYKDYDNSYSVKMSKWDKCDDYDWYQLYYIVRGITSPYTDSIQDTFIVDLQCGVWHVVQRDIINGIAVNYNNRKIGDDFTIESDLMHRGCFIFCTNNTDAHTSYTFRKDHVSPYFTINANNSYFVYTKISGLQTNDSWYSDSVKIITTPKDDGSGVAYLEYQLNGTDELNWIKRASDYSMQTNLEGKNTVYFRVKDNLDNCSAIISAPLNIDKTPPGKLTNLKLNLVTDANQKVNKLRLSWDPVVDYYSVNSIKYEGGAGVKGYEITYQSANDPLSYIVKATNLGRDNNQFYLDLNNSSFPITRGKAYRFAVRALDNLDNKSDADWTFVVMAGPDGSLTNSITIPSALEIGPITFPEEPKINSSGQSVYPYAITFNSGKSILNYIQSITIEYNGMQTEYQVDDIRSPVTNDLLMPWSENNNKLTFTSSIIGKEYAHKIIPFTLITKYKPELGSTLEKSATQNSARLLNNRPSYRLQIEDLSGDSIKFVDVINGNVTAEVSDLYFNTNKTVNIRVLGLNPDGSVSDDGLDVEGDKLAYQLYDISGVPLSEVQLNTNGSIVFNRTYNCFYECYVNVVEYVSSTDGDKWLYDSSYYGANYHSSPSFYLVDTKRTGFFVYFDSSASTGEFRLTLRNPERTPVDFFTPTRTEAVAIKIGAGKLTDFTNSFNTGIDNVYVWNIDPATLSGIGTVTAETISELDKNGSFPSKTALNLSSDRDQRIPANDFYYDWDLIPRSQDKVEENKIAVMKIVDKVGNSYYSIQNVILDTLPPNSPAINSFSLFPASLDISWLPVSDSHYQVSYFSPVDNSYTEPQTCTGTSFKIPLNEYGPNQLVSAKIQAVDRAGNVSEITDFAHHTLATLGNVSIQSKGTNQNGRYISYLLGGGIAKEQKLEVWKDGSVTDTLTAVANVFTHTGLIPHTTYTYKLIALNDSGDRTVGEPFTVSSTNTAPPAPALIAPVANGYFSSQSYFSWQHVTDPDGDELVYHLYLVKENTAELLTTTSGFSYPDPDKDILPADLLVNGATYSWYVVADDINSNPASGEARQTSSEQLSFTIDNEAPRITTDYTKDVVFTNKQSLSCQITEELSGIKRAVYWTSDGQIPASNPQPILLSSDNNGLYSGTLALHPSSGAYNITILAEDGAGNETTISLERLGVDQINPQVLAVGLSSAQESSGIYLAASNKLVAAIHANDDNAGLAKLFYGFVSAPGAEPALWTTLSLDELPNYNGEAIDKQYTRSLTTDAEDGSITYLAVKVQDWAGNTSPVFYMENGIFKDASQPNVQLNINGFTCFGSEYFIAQKNQLQVSLATSDLHSTVSTTITICEENGTPDQWYNDWNAAVQADLVPGKKYQIRARAVNRAGLASEKTSLPFIFDNSVPDNFRISIEPNNEVIPGETIRIRVSSASAYSPVIAYKLALGLTPGTNEFSSLIAGNENGQLIKQGPGEVLFAFAVPEITDGNYYLSVSAINAAGITGTYASGPKALTVNSNTSRVLVWDRGPYSTSTTTFEGRWEYHGSGTVAEFEYCLATVSGPITAWTKTNEKNAIIDNLNLEDGHVYWLEVRALFTDENTSPVGRSLGVMIDATAPQFAAEGGLVLPVATTSSQLHLSYNVSDHQSGLENVEVLIQAYNAEGQLYPISGNWLSLGKQEEASQIVIRTDSTGQPLNLVTGQRVYISLRATDKAGLATERTGAGIMIDDTLPPVPRVNDYTDAINPVQYPEADWIFSEADQQSGISNFYWTLVRTPDRVPENTQWYPGSESRISQVEAVLGTSFPRIHGETWYFAVKAVNGAGLESIGFSNGFTFDETAPLMAASKLVQADNLASAAGAQELYYLSDANNLKVYVDAVEEETSIISYKAETGYWDHALNWQPQNNGAYTSVDSLIPLENPAPIFSLDDIVSFRSRCTNAADFVSEVSYTKGAILDLVNPEILALHSNAQGDELYFDWQGNSAIPIAYYSVLLVKENETLATTWQNLGPVTHAVFQASAFGLTDGRYLLKVKAVSASGRESTVVISPPVILDRSAPELVQFNTPKYTSTKLKFYIEARDEQSGLTEYQYALGTFEDDIAFTKKYVSIFSRASALEYTIEFSDLAAGLEGVKDGSILYLKMRAKNGAGSFSPIWVSEPILIDRTPPTVPVVIAPSFNSYDNKITGISINSNDMHSGITHYRLAVMTDPSAVGVANATWHEFTVGSTDELYSLNLSDYTLNSLTLDDNSFYYLAVQTRNGAGDWSVIGFSEKFLIDINLPKIHFSDSGKDIVLNQLPYVLTYRLDENPYTEVEVEFIIVHLKDNITEKLSVIRQPKGTYQLSFDRDAYGPYKITANLRDAGGRPVNDADMVALRVNAPPAIVLHDFDTTPGKELTLYATIIEPDGELDLPCTYKWRLTADGQNTSDAIQPIYTYYHANPLIGFTRYPIELTVTDRNGKSATANAVVNVKNTKAGQLYTNEFWSGEHYITDDIIVPEDITLTLQAGTTVTVTGNDLSGYNHRITIQGHLDASAGSTIKMEDGNPHLWNGLLVEGSGSLAGLTIQNAYRGLTLATSQSVTLTNCTFRQNQIGLHLVGTSPDVSGCSFIANSYYGIKEDAGAEPKVLNCLFNNNLYDYYDETETVISAARLNLNPGNSANTTDKEMEN